MADQSSIPADDLRPSASPELDFRAAPDAAALLAALPGSELLRRSAGFFERYPAKSLMNEVSRSLLYLLVRQVRPRVALEIGTSYAGTAEVLARALLANGHGELLTVDPFGAARVPPIVQSWPEALRRRVTFLGEDSMHAFMVAGQQGILFDFAFVDGDHSFEFAQFDLRMVARHAAPGAIVVMDNCEQPGVFWATRQFLAEQPGWRELGDAISSYRDSDPFRGLRPSFPRSSFLILQAPQEICLAGAPRSFESGIVEQPGLRGVELEVEPDHGGGALHLLTFFRSFNHDLSIGEPEQRLAVDEVMLAPGQADLQLAFAAPFVTGLDPLRSYRRFEFILSWIPDQAGEPLRLRRAPAAVVLD